MGRVEQRRAAPGQNEGGEEELWRAQKLALVTALRTRLGDVSEASRAAMDAQIRIAEKVFGATALTMLMQRRDETERRWSLYTARAAGRGRKRASRTIDVVLSRCGWPGRALFLQRTGLWDWRYADYAPIGMPVLDTIAYARGASGFVPALFDDEHYRRNNPDIAAAGLSPFVHYLLYGDREGRTPHPLFSPDHYRGQCAEAVAKSGLSTLEHFFCIGAARGVAPHPLFDVKFYVSQSKSLAESGENPLIHYLRIGWRQGLSPHPLFDNDWYIRSNRDIGAAMAPPLLHYVIHGGAEGRDPHPHFSTKRYRAHKRAKTKGGRDPLSDYLAAEPAARVNVSGIVDPVFYLRNNPDVAAARLDPLAHFLVDGVWESRAPSAELTAAGFQARALGAGEGGSAHAEAMAEAVMDRRRLADAQKVLRNSALFDPAYYRAHAGVAVGVDPLTHYVERGWLEGLNPHPLFDNDYYLAARPDLLESLTPPLLDYVLSGAGGADPHPLFWSSWYAARNMGPGERITPLEHYLRWGVAQRRDPCPFFGVDFYLTSQPDVADAGWDPLIHFASVGVREGRAPNPSGLSYEAVAEHPALASAPIVRAWILARAPSRPKFVGEEARALFAALSTKAGEAVAQAYDIQSYIDLKAQLSKQRPEGAVGRRANEAERVRTIAFYLPQFHRIPENEEWWGPGFTEWANVTRALPNFPGHYQPHRPADLGFYDLSRTDVMEEQAALAHRYGITGFCYYYYWFSGRRVLEMPTERLLATGKPALPFCLCWANENWTRTWDGLDREVLLRQENQPDDAERFIADVSRFFTLPHYIRIDGRPLLVVYRPDLLPPNAVEIWRRWAREKGFGELYLAHVEQFDFARAYRDPKAIGFDASIEFPPARMPAPIEPPHPLFNANFTGAVSDYREMVRQYAAEPIAAFTRFRGVMPSWDNTARRQDGAHCFHDATPGAFQAWLEHVYAETLARNAGEERFVFINAWNEWAEGAHLEPDQRFGHGWLEAVRSAQDAAGVRG